MQFKKVNIFDTYGKKVYSDQHGQMDNSRIHVSVYDDDSKHWYDDSDVFIKIINKYERLRDHYKTINIKKIFDRKLFIRNQKNRGYYYNSTPQNNEQAQSINCSKINVEFRNFYVEIDKSDKQAFNIEVWVTDTDGWDLHRVKYHMLRQGDLVYFAQTECTCKVSEIFEPNSNNNVCNIESLKDGQIYTINSKNDQLYWVPYIEHKGELAIFNDKNNELALSPYVLKEGNTRNIFWRPVEEASQYIVSVYKFYHDRYNDCKNILYHMKDFYVERNTCFLVLKDLIDENYIITVAAENRNGEIIAKSRGIADDGFPKFWSVY